MVNWSLIKNRMRTIIIILIAFTFLRMTMHTRGEVEIIVALRNASLGLVASRALSPNPCPLITSLT